MMNPEQARENLESAVYQAKDAGLTDTDILRDVEYLLEAIRTDS